MGFGRVETQLSQSSVHGRTNDVPIGGALQMLAGKFPVYGKLIKAQRAQKLWVATTIVVRFQERLGGLLEKFLTQLRIFDSQAIALDAFPVPDYSPHLGRSG